MEEREKKKRRERKTNEWKIHEFAYVRRVWFISFWVEKKYTVYRLFDKIDPLEDF